ncbi:hypothetical protein DFA_10093 [Cavenderia fasciculata]|uniref:Uncharacterized protein n=1 Tax=Cavenderia fasciculata TaxID=261658 RepID=F4Q990_CACFS|nr:uncharacterized protein DFA_10093 [Cavenderia fasciculata]EGG15259.1 hypothetical protein DFA_10093 [Cavenderia fasciculata]|eukprot:XP_004351979.1 hypothetical protein DFA_10093 [Cavenderia fasciculata]
MILSRISHTAADNDNDDGDDNDNNHQKKQQLSLGQALLQLLNHDDKDRDTHLLLDNPKENDSFSTIDRELENQKEGDDDDDSIMISIIEAMTRSFIDIHKHEFKKSTLVDDTIIGITLDNQSASAASTTTTFKQYYRPLILFRYLYNNHLERFFKSINRIITNLVDDSLKRKALDTILLLKYFMSYQQQRGSVAGHSLTIRQYLLEPIVEMVIPNSLVKQQPTKLSIDTADCFISSSLNILNDQFNIDQSFLNTLTSFIDHLLLWYSNVQSKSLYCIAIRMLKEYINHCDEACESKEFYIGILPLLYFQYSLSTKDKLVEYYLKLLLNDDERIDYCCISFILILGLLSEKKMNQFKNDNVDKLLIVSYHLAQYNNEKRTKHYCSILIGITFSLNLNSDNNDGDRTIENIISMVLSKQEEPNNATLNFIAKSIITNQSLLYHFVSTMETISNTSNSLLLLEYLIKVPSIVLKFNDNILFEKLLNQLLKILYKQDKEFTKRIQIIFNGLEVNQLTRKLIFLIINDTTNDQEKLVLENTLSSLLEFNTMSVFELFIDLVLHNEIDSNETNDDISPSNLLFDSKQPITTTIDINQLLNLIPSIFKNIKWFSNPKDGNLTKILQKLLSLVKSSFIVEHLLDISRLKMDQQMIVGNDSEFQEHEIFQILSPILFLKSLLKHIHQQKQTNGDHQNALISGGDRILVVDQLYQLLSKRIRSNNLLMDIRKLSSECCSYFPCIYWVPTSLSMLSNENITMAINKDSSIVTMKLVMFSLCNSLLLNGVEMEPFIHSVAQVVDTLFHLQQVVGSTAEEIKKLQMGAGDCLAFMVCASVNDEGYLWKTFSFDLIHKSGMSQIKDIKSVHQALPTILKILKTPDSITATVTPMLYYTLLTVTKVLQVESLVKVSKSIIPSLVNIFSSDHNNHNSSSILLVKKKRKRISVTMEMTSMTFC